MYINDIRLNLLYFIYLAKITLLTVICVTVQSVSAAGASNEKDKDKTIYSYGPGVHYIDSLVLDKKHSVVEGVAPGATILKVKKGIHFKAANPVIRNLTIVGEGDGIGILLENTWTARIQDVEVENYKTGIKFELTGHGREVAGGKTMNLWPGALTSGQWGSRTTLSELRNVEITGPGNGIVFENKLKTSTKKNYWKPTNDRKAGEFINATTIWGGHIGVRGKAVVIGDGVYATKMFGTYIDVSAAGGIFMEYGARGLLLVGVALDLNSAARKVKAERLVVPKRAKKSVTLLGVSPKKFDIKYFK